jgi:CO/xanthine dehydrogenase Mo-binding subunit
MTTETTPRTSAEIGGMGHSVKRKEDPRFIRGQGEYIDDVNLPGQLWLDIVRSPYAHATIKGIDASEALAMPGVKAILTPDDMPKPADAMTDLGQRIPANPLGERGLTNEPVYQGEPILAVCAVDELTCAEAIEKIRIDFERLPHVVDPLVSLRPGGPNARTAGNVWFRPVAAAGQPAPPPQVQEVKWTAEDFAAAKDGQLPLGKGTDPEWSFGDVEAGLKKADLVLDEWRDHRCICAKPFSKNIPMRTLRWAKSLITSASTPITSIRWGQAFSFQPIERRPSLDSGF